MITNEPGLEVRVLHLSTKNHRSNRLTCVSRQDNKRSSSITNKFVFGDIADSSEHHLNIEDELVPSTLSPVSSNGWYSCSTGQSHFAQKLHSLTQNTQNPRWTTITIALWSAEAFASNPRRLLASQNSSSHECYPSSTGTGFVGGNSPDQLPIHGPAVGRNNGFEQTMPLLPIELDETKAGLEDRTPIHQNDCDRWSTTAAT